MELTLTHQEAELLHDLLDRALTDLRQEIQHTDRKAFKASLKTEEAQLQAILGRLPVVAAPHA
ncbi:MAG TPA: hypothetical protein VF804_06050 [Holophagaceae bacterium]